MVNQLDPEQLAEYFNIELFKNQNMSVNKLCDKIGIKAGTFKTKMRNAGYSFNTEFRQYIKPKEIIEEFQEVAILQEPTTNITSNIAVDEVKLNMFFSNIDYFLNMLPKDNITKGNMRSNMNKNITFKVDTGLHAALKERAVRDNTSIAEILNRAIDDYFEKYI